MPESIEPTFNQYSVIIARIASLEQQSNLRFNTIELQGKERGEELRTRLDEINSHLLRVLDDHETRLRNLETRLIIAVSLGLAILITAVVVTWVIAKQ